MISVVVADARADAPTVSRHLAALRSELSADDQVVWVDVAGRPPEAAGFTLVDAPPNCGRGQLYGLGLESARHAMVAFTDSRSELQPGWRAVAVKALGAGAKVVGGPVLPDRLHPLRTAAGFMVEYGPHAASPFHNARGDVSANNVAYAREALESVVSPGDPVWKSFVNERLASRGIAPVVLPDMRVTSIKRYGWHDLGCERAAQGRFFGSQRAARWSRARRVAAAAGCTGLPLLSYGRLWAQLRHDPRLRSPFIRCTPLVLVALASWSAGEAIGYLAGESDGNDVF